MRSITHSPVRTVKSVRCSSIGELNPVARILSAMDQSLPALNATTVSSPVCTSFSVTVLLGFCDFKNRAVCKAMSFRCLRLGLHHHRQQALDGHVVGVRRL